MEPVKVHLRLDPTVAMEPWAVRRPRRASDLRGVYRDAAALDTLICRGDPVIYETFELPIPEAPGHLMFGITVVLPGRVGDEYFMTKGHYHVQRQTAEVYMALRGRGYLVMETEQGQARVIPMEPGSVVYLAPGWAHRTVNTGEEPFVLFYTFPADAGHDYEAVARNGFALAVREVEGTPTVQRRAEASGRAFAGG